MTEQLDISVIITTYNRAAMLPPAVEGVLGQSAAGVSYEVIVVDNNSPDRTREVVESFIAQGAKNLRYVFEGKQGVSHARNAGVMNARAPIVAFFDDDVRVGPDWVATIKKVFDEHPEVDCVGGKVLPAWEAEPPSWLTREHWAPLALQDYGDAPTHVNVANPICLISANLAFRREVLESLGGFAPDLQRVKDGIGSMEDHELLVRFWRSGRQGLYVPDLIATTAVTAERLTKTYHRRWHTGHGYFYALMRLEEMERGSARLFDVPSHLYKSALKNLFGWLRYSLTFREELAFECANEIRFFRGFFRQRRKEFKASKHRSTPREVTSFVRSLIASKRRKGQNPESRIQNPE